MVLIYFAILYYLVVNCNFEYLTWLVLIFCLIKAHQSDTLQYKYLILLIITRAKVNKGRIISQRLQLLATMKDRLSI